MAAAQAAENHEMSEAWPDACDNGHICQFQHELTHKIQQQQQQKHCLKISSYGASLKWSQRLFQSAHE